MLNDILEITEEIKNSRYPQAEVVFLAGSIVRGEGTSTSDLDLVVLYKDLPCAYRESYRYGEWPVEAFVHDPQTLEYFFREIDRPSGIPSLASMLAEGIEVPRESEFSNTLKQLAQSVLDEDPPEWTKQELNNSRYGISDLIEDLKDPRSIQEMHASATVLYTALANHYFRSRKTWSAKDKAIPRRLHKVDPNLATSFLDGFEDIFSRNSTEAIIELAAEILERDGGFLFEDHRLEAPESWRIVKS